MLNKRSTLMVLALLLAPFVMTGCSSENSTSPVSTQEDSVPPMAPTAWQPKAIGNSALLRWAKNTEADLAGYNVYKYEPNPQNHNSYIVINSQPTTGNTYTINGLTSGMTYYFRTTAVDMSGNESGYSQVMAVSVGVDVETPENPGYPDAQQIM
ncbi:MAG: fibronectin type III domain-containing protein [Candidatus Eisenbacteria bacterium]|nr:fibronectin type III domain-containing protein [Candidatus Eisenbacteria bacterium]